MEKESSSVSSPEKRWAALAHRLGIRAENAVDAVRARFLKKFSKKRPMEIVAFHGMGNDSTCRIGGRVLEYTKDISDEIESIWRNLQDSYRRFETDEVPGVKVVCSLGSEQFLTTTDDEGYFSIEFPSPADRARGNLTVELSLPDYQTQHQPSHGTIFFPHREAAFGVISDIDDTIMVTKATSIVRMMRLTLLESSSSRTPFAGVAAFYKALHNKGNPFFYVSSSPWNLFDFLDDFIHINGITPGPLLLRDFGIDETKLFTGPHRQHKLAQIRSVLDFYPDLRFILIGDSGQHDPEIYTQIVSEFPTRILSVYIRDEGDSYRDREVQQMIKTLEASSVEMLLVPDTLVAAIHAAGKRYISKSSLAKIENSVRQQSRVLPETT